MSDNQITTIDKETAGSSNAPDPNLTEPASFSKTWFLYRIPTLLAWIWLILKLTGWLLPLEYRIESYLIYPYLICLLGLVLTGRWLLAIFYPFYFFLSPLLVVFLPIAFIVRGFQESSNGASRLVSSVSKAVTFLRSFKAIIVLMLIAIMLWLATNFYIDTIYRPSFALAAHISTYLLFLQSFRWAANPYKPILHGLRFISKHGGTIIRTLFIDPNIKKKLEERKQSYQTCSTILSGLEKIHNPENPLTQGITSITHGRLSAIFTGFFFLMYLMVALSFSQALFEVERGWGKLISGLSEIPDRFTYFYFSFLSQATAIPDGVQALNHYGEIWLIWMVLTGLLLLTGLITLFTSAAGVYSDSTLEEIDTIFDEMKSKVEAYQNELIAAPDPD